MHFKKIRVLPVLSCIVLEFRNYSLHEEDLSR